MPAFFRQSPYCIGLFKTSISSEDELLEYFHSTGQNRNTSASFSYVSGDTEASKKISQTFYKQYAQAISFQLDSHGLPDINSLVEITPSTTGQLKMQPITLGDNSSLNNGIRRNI